MANKEITDLQLISSMGDGVNIPGDDGVQTYRVTGAQLKSFLAPVPVGSIIPFYDFDGGLSFDTNLWVYCDGGTATVGGVSRTLPDLSGRYMVGFGTDGGGDIDTATWATAAVGNASHQVSLAHSHAFGRIISGTTREFRFYGSGKYLNANDYWRFVLNTSTMASGGFDSYGWGKAWSGAFADGDDFYTNTAGSATQSIQPRSVRVRYIMRKA